MNSYFYNELIEDKKTKSMIQFFQTYAEEQMKQVCDYYIHDFIELLDIDF